MDGKVAPRYACLLEKTQSMSPLRPGDIVLVDFGSVYLGRKLAGLRPGVFVYQEGGVALVIPFTSNLDRLRYRAALLIKPDSENKLEVSSVALVFQMQLFNAHNVTKSVGTLSRTDKRRVNATMRSILLLS